MALTSTVNIYAFFAVLYDDVYPKNSDAITSSKQLEITGKKKQKLRGSKRITSMYC